MKYYWVVTGITGAKNLVAKCKRNGMGAWQLKGNAIILAENKPWGILAGHMLRSTEIRQFDERLDAEAYIKEDN